MEDFLFSLNIILPLAALMALGYFFHQIGLFSDAFIKQGKKLCFYALLSSTLFKNLYDSTITQAPYSLIILVVFSIIGEFVISIFIAKAISERKDQIGVIIQGAVRSNFAYIGIPLASMMFADSELVSRASSQISIISIFVIPLFNIFSVVALTCFNGKEDKGVARKTLINIARNPCIISIVLGLIVLLVRALIPGSAFFIKNNLSFIYKVIGYLASMSTPLALLLVGASLDFSHSISNLKKLAWVVGLKDLLFPFAVLAIAYVLNIFGKVEYAVLVSTFASPTAVASAIMASELDGDYDLANEIVIYTTVFSIFSLLIIIYALKTMGCL